MPALRFVAYVWNIQEYDPNYIICAFSDRKRTCHGDSGGPIIDWNPINGLPNLKAVIGATSWGPRNSNNPGDQYSDVTGAPGYFADVPAGWDWIYETIKGTKLLPS